MSTTDHAAAIRATITNAFHAVNRTVTLTEEDEHHLLQDLDALAAEMAEARSLTADALAAELATSDALIREQVIRDLIRQAEAAEIPDSEGGWDIRYDVADWLRGRLPDPGDLDDQEVTR